MAFKKILRTDSANQFKFDKVGAQIKGHYLTTMLLEIDGREVKKHVFQTEKGMLSCLGNYDLNDQLSQINPGTYVEIEFVGTKALKKGKQAMKLFEVNYDDENVVDVADVQTASPAAEAEEDGEAYAAEAESEAEEELEEEQDKAPARVALGAKRPVQASEEQRLRVQAMLNRNKAKK